ncbi:MAG: SurA N-terminal domain-containing protein [Deltaproteobacteria bacterium]|nr:SurA N-terminal domain-containing protein [Deltaproteobacteria bacterium]
MMHILWGLIISVYFGLPVGTIIDRVVAVVDKQVITQSELMCEARILLVLREGENAANIIFDQKMLNAFTDYLVNQALITAQVSRLGILEINSIEIKQEVNHFMLRFHSKDAYNDFMEKYDITTETLQNILARNLRNQRFITERMRLRIVSGEKLNQDSEQYQAELRRWLNELKEAVDVRLLGPSNLLEVVPKENSIDKK